MPHAGDLLAELLVRYGVTHVFGQPGGQTVALYDGIARRPRIRHVLVRDERSAAYAADAFARLTGRPGICDVTVGPGTTKLTDGFVESLNASVPVIALVGELPRDWAPYRDFGVASQAFDQVRFLSSISKATLSVPSVAALPQMVRAAFRVSTSGRPGPVALILPHDVIDSGWQEDQASLEVDDRYVRAPSHRPLASADAIQEAVALLTKSRRPLIVAGGGVHASRATEELAALAAKLDAVVVTSLSGKGAVDEGAPGSAGVLNPLGTTESLELARRADVVFWCGSKVGQNTSNNWTIPLAGQGTIHLDSDATELGRTFRPTVALNGDARATLDALVRALPSEPRAEWRAEFTRARQHASAQRSEDEGSDAVPILPQRLMHELSMHLRPDDVVISDASFAAGWIATHLPARKSGRGFLFARGQGGLGYAVPAAIGAAMARPEARVVTVSGDGGFSYGIGELATHAQQGLRTINLVLNNGALSWLVMYQHLFFDGLRESVDLEGEQLDADFAAVASGLGCLGIRVTDPQELAGALEAAFASTKPVVVDVRTDQSRTPIHSYTRRLAEGRFFARPGTVYELVEWRRSPDEPSTDS